MREAWRHQYVRPVALASSNLQQSALLPCTLPTKNSNEFQARHPLFYFRWVLVPAPRSLCTLSEQSGKMTFPQIHGARLQRMFFSTPEYNMKTCTVYRRRHHEAAQRPLYYPESKGRRKVTV